MPVIDRKIYFNDAARKQNLVFAIILLILQIAFCAAYGFIFRAPLQIINITSIITAIALAMLAVPGTFLFMKGLDCCLDILESWYGVELALTFLFSPSVSSFILWSIMYAQGEDFKAIIIHNYHLVERKFMISTLLIEMLLPLHSLLGMETASPTL